jgi:hypothetical protein
MLGASDLAIQIGQRALQRRQQILDRFFPPLEVRGGFGARLAETAFRQIEKGTIVRLQGFGAHRTKGVAQPGLGILERADPLGMNGLILQEIRLQAHTAGARREPADKRSHAQREKQGENELKVDGHQYRTRRLSRHDKRQPDGRKLELGRMRRGCENTRAFFTARPTFYETARDALNRMTCRDLGATPTLGKPAVCRSRVRPRCQPLHFEHGETRLVDGLERQRHLKPGVRRGVEIAGGLD